MKSIFLLSIVTLLVSSEILAIPPKNGVSVCPNGDCNYRNASIGVTNERDEANTLKSENQSTSLEQKKKVEIKKAKPKNNSLTVKKENPSEVESNLPEYYQKVKKSSASEQDAVVYVAPQKPQKLSQVYAGDIFQGVIEQQILVSSQVKQPIRATLISGPYKGSIVMGEASLDSELKRVLIEFKSLRTSHDKKTYTFKAVALSQEGNIGLKGEYHSEIGKFFVAEAVSAFAGAALDSTIQRNQNLLGGYANEPSLGNAAKTGAVTAMSKTTEKLAESVRNAPEYTKAPAYQEIKILIQEEPKESL